MKLIRIVTAVMLVALAVPAAWAAPQEEDSEQIVSWVYHIKVDLNMVPEFEMALRHHAHWHEHNLPDQSYGIGQILTGENAGKYIVVIGDRHWGDFDIMGSKEGAADQENWATTGGKLSKETASIINVAMPDVSRPPTGPFGFV